MQTAISKGELLAFASRLGVSERQLKRWRKHGLLPTPVLESQGRAKGMVAFYPASTRDQLVDLCRFQDRYRKLDDIGWMLWSQGYSHRSLVQLARRRMEQYVAAPTDFITDALKNYEETEDPDNPIDRSESARLPKGLGAVRRRVHPESMSTVTRLAFSILSGTLDLQHGFETSDFALLLRGMSALASREDPPELEVEAKKSREAFEALTPTVNLRGVLSVLREAPDHAYVECRDQCQSGLEWFAGETAWQHDFIPPSVFVVWFCLLNWSDASREISEQLATALPARYREEATKQQMPDEER